MMLGVMLVLEGRLAAQSPVPAKVHRYAKRLVEQYDRNGDGKLQEEEWQRMRGQPARMDADGDRVITTDELTQWIVAFGAQRKLRLVQPVTEETAETSSSDRPSGQEEAKAEDGSSASPPEQAKPSSEASPPPAQAGVRAPTRQGRFHVSAKRMPPGLPPWFLQRDTNGDGQITLSEFAPKATAEDRREFSRYDLNGDGVVTPQECTRNVKPAKSAPSQTKTP